MRVLVLADDLTGASDTVVQFARAGWPSLLSLSGGWREEPTEDAVALTLDTRRDPHAERLTARAAADLATGALYLKIDSTVRGRVAEQVRGALAGVRRRRPASYAVVCPPIPRSAAPWSTASSWSTGPPCTRAQPAGTPSPR